MEWSPQQEAAIKKAQGWLRDKSAPQVHYIAGYAGTGKTTLAKEVAGDQEKVLFGAYTGKAASVMRKKGCDEASTIHSMIYRIKKGDDGQPLDPMEFELNGDSDVTRAKLVIIDECSMVGADLGRDLLSFGTKVLVIGDPAQLPPVQSAGFFTNREPDTMLTEVHRQARDNPIIRLSMEIREGRQLQPGAYGETMVVEQNKTIPEWLAGQVMSADQIIVGLNRTRVSYNKRLREMKGMKGHNNMPVKGDKLVCLKNDRRQELLNGTLWYVVDAKNHQDIVHMKVANEDDASDTRGVRVRREFFQGTEASLEWQDKKGTQEFTYGYALTAHKSQGSQWNSIVVFDEGASFRDEAARWRYTAITRAAERVTVII